MAEKSLYERLDGAFGIAAVVDYFSDEVVKDPIAGQKSKNPDLREWHTRQLGRLPGLKFMRTPWVCAAAGGPMTYAGTKPGKTDWSELQLLWVILRKREPALRWLPIGLFHSLIFSLYSVWEIVMIVLRRIQYDPFAA
jgi:hypothetical protein